MGIWVPGMIEGSVFDKRLLSLKSTAYLGYYYRFNLAELISSLIDLDGSEVTTDPSRWNMDTGGYSEIYKMWQEAKFNSSSIKWINYYPDKHYTQDLVNDAARYLRLSGVHRSWISRIDPGFYAPWHWDVDDNEHEYLTKGNIKKYSIMLGKPALGHIFIVGEDYLYNLPEGSIFKWKNYRDWHAGINAGMTPNFMLHILGY
jgi:hypothetical protein